MLKKKEEKTEMLAKAMGSEVRKNRRKQKWLSTESNLALPVTVQTSDNGPHFCRDPKISRALIAWIGGNFATSCYTQRLNYHR